MDSDLNVMSVLLQHFLVLLFFFSQSWCRFDKWFVCLIMNMWRKHKSVAEVKSSGRAKRAWVSLRSSTEVTQLVWFGWQREERARVNRMASRAGAKVHRYVRGQVGCSSRVQHICTTLGGSQSKKLLRYTPPPNPGVQTRRRPLTSRTHSGGVMGWLISEQRYGQQLKMWDFTLICTILLKPFIKTVEISNFES